MLRRLWKSSHGNRRALIHYFHGNQPRVCIIGSGPAGFYTAQHLLKHHSKVQVDIFEKLPVPFGLVRYGVAPDHPEVKNATSSFEEVAKNSRCRFYGNVNIGDDLKASELRAVYDAVVFAYGADDDKKLHIPGEDTEGVYSARTFVGWYNGLPAHADLSPNLDCETAVIIGQGNVALDVARILLAPLKLLQGTDICEHAMDALSKSRIEKVHIVGRRSPLEVSFTIKELREMIRLPQTSPVFLAEDFVHIRPIIKDLPRQRKRLIDLMCTTALDGSSLGCQSKRWFLHFLRSPVEVVSSEGNVAGVKFEINKLAKNENDVVTMGTGEMDEIVCGMVLRSIGYKSVKVEEGIPFDQRLGVIPNVDGRVIEKPASNQVVNGLYCSGWVKHGPVGVIATTMNESFATAEKIVEDLNSGRLQSTSLDDVRDLMQRKGIKYVTFADYERIDQEEMWRGRERNKPREKIVSDQEMLDLAFNEKDS